MPKSDSNILTTKERCSLDAFEADIEAAKNEILSAVPEDIALLGGVIREALQTGNYSEFREILVAHGVDINEKDIEHFIDLLIIQRFDMKDLEPAARMRLRHRTLLREDQSMMTPDYKQATELSGIPNCRDCKWFMDAPDDADINSDKSCVELGTKGADQACLGFTLKRDYKA